MSKQSEQSTDCKHEFGEEYQSDIKWFTHIYSGLINPETEIIYYNLKAKKCKNCNIERVFSPTGETYLVMRELAQA